MLFLLICLIDGLTSRFRIKVFGFEAMICMAFFPIHFYDFLLVIVHLSSCIQSLNFRRPFALRSG